MKEMAINIRTDSVYSVRDIDPQQWDTLVKSSSVATWFQTQEAYDFFSSMPFFETFVIGVKSKGQLKGLVVGYIQKDGGKLKQFLSRRAIITGGPLLAEDITDEELRTLLYTLKKQIGKKAIYIETRNFNDYRRWSNMFEECGFEYSPHYDVHVKTSSIEAVNSNLDRNRRRNIKKALENGIFLEYHPDSYDLQRFYTMLEELYRTKVKSPLFPYKFFEKLAHLPSSIFIIAKNPANEVVGGLACVSLIGKAVYAWATCGDDKNNKSLSPSVMANYAGICYAAEHGFPCFDFMGAGKPEDGGYGVRDFKLKFGGVLVEHGRYIHICNIFLFSFGKFAIKILKR